MAVAPETAPGNSNLGSSVLRRRKIRNEVEEENNVNGSLQLPGTVKEDSLDYRHDQGDGGHDGEYP